MLKSTVLYSLICALTFVVGARAGANDQRSIDAETPAQLPEMVIFERVPEPLPVIEEAQPQLAEVPKTAEPEPINEAHAEMLARLLWAEYRDQTNYNQCAAVCWCVLWRAETWGMTVEEVITAPNQFAWNPSAPVDAGLYDIAVDVLEKYRGGEEGVLPREYLWFSGNGKYNTFRNAYAGGERIVP